MPEIEANWTISLCAAEETNYILCRLDSRPPLTYQTTNNQLTIYIYIEHKLVNKKIVFSVFSKILPHFKDERGINSLHSNVVQQCGKTLRCVCVVYHLFIYPASLTEESGITWGHWKLLGIQIVWLEIFWTHRWQQWHSVRDGTSWAWLQSNSLPVSVKVTDLKWFCPVVKEETGEISHTVVYLEK